MIFDVRNCTDFILLRRTSYMLRGEEDGLSRDINCSVLVLLICGFQVADGVQILGVEVGLLPQPGNPFIPSFPLTTPIAYLMFCSSLIPTNPPLILVIYYNLVFAC